MDATKGCPHHRNRHKRLAPWGEIVRYPLSSPINEPQLYQTADKTEPRYPIALFRAKTEPERAEYEDNLDHRQPGMGATRRIFLFIPKMWVAATPVVVRHLGDDPRLAP